uniref:Translocase of outer mitochondrial membrane 7 n=2 Tax=Canis lupus familiaris TaxID=9615 RepID=A0A8C0RUB1_CANLF
MSATVCVGFLCQLRSCTANSLDDFCHRSHFIGFKRGADPGMPEPTVLSLLWG